MGRYDIYIYTSFQIALFDKKYWPWFDEVFLFVGHQIFLNNHFYRKYFSTRSYLSKII